MYAKSIEEIFNFSTDFEKIKSYKRVYNFFFTITIIFFSFMLEFDTHSTYATYATRGIKQAG